jgi:8-oxo-dGTP diphosphatase
MSRERPIVVAANVLITPDNLLLMGRRSDCAKWEVPGGKLEAGETVEQAGRREMYEETGMLLYGNPVLLGFADVPGAVDADTRTYVVIFIRWPAWEGFPHPKDGHTGWQWWDLNSMPSPSSCTVGTVKLLTELLPVKGVCFGG